MSTRTLRSLARSSHAYGTVDERRRVKSNPVAHVPEPRPSDSPSIRVQDVTEPSIESLVLPSIPEIVQSSRATADSPSASETTTRDWSQCAIVEDDGWQRSYIERKQFYALLLRYITGQPPPILRRLLDLHHAYPHLQSAESYNLLINFCLRRTAWAIAKRVYSSMARAGLPPNMYTWRLRVRMLTLIGDTQRAFECALAGIGDLGPSPHGKIPTLVWFELFWNPAPIRDNTLALEGDDMALRKRIRALATRQHAQMPPSQRFSRYFDPAIMPDLSRRTFRPHLVARCVRFLAVHTEPLQSELAEKLTRSYLQSLPTKLTREERIGAILVINQNFHVHLGHHNRSTYHPRPTANAPPGLKTHIRHRALCEDLLQIHRGVSPNAETVRLLLGSLRGINIERAVKYAKRLVKDFEYRWGRRTIIDLSVQRILAKMAHRFRHQRAFTRKAILQADENLMASRRIAKQQEQEQVVATTTRSLTREGAAAHQTEQLATRLMLRQRILQSTPSRTEFGSRGSGSSERSKYFRFRGKAEVHGVVPAPDISK